MQKIIIIIIKSTKRSSLVWVFGCPRDKARTSPAISTATPFPTFTAKCQHFHFITEA